MTERSAAYPIHPQFIDRWSPRSFMEYDMPLEELRSLLEAARWSPSCANEQPWLFYCALGQEKVNQYLPLLEEGNQVWVKQASALLFLGARKIFSESKKPNLLCKFDAGAAWMSLTLQAQALGLATHAMSGIKSDAIYEMLKINRIEVSIICAIAVGKRGSADLLPEALKIREKPNNRKMIENFEVRL